MLTISWRGLDEWLSGLSTFADTVQRLPETEDAAQELADTAAANSPVLTGELAGSWTTLVEADGSAVTFAEADHAPPIIVGVPSHNIEPHPVVGDAVAARQSAVLLVLEEGVEAAADRAGL